jgi:flagellar assembly protein FliH
MALEKGIIKSETAAATTFEFKPRELTYDASPVARSFVSEDAFISTDFKISQLIADQAGISELEDTAQRDKINSQVLEQLKEVQEKAYQEGYELGLVEGTEKAFQEAKGSLLERMKAMESMLKRLEELKTRMLIDNESTIVRLLFLVAKKIAMRDLEQHREAVWEILQHVIGGIQEDEKVVVRISAEDLFFLESLQDKSGQRIETLQRVKFISDEAIKAGGCLIETDHGTVDATLEERMERTWQTLQSRIPHKAPEKKD